MTLRLARNRIAPFALLTFVGAVLAAGGWFPPRETVWVLLALALNVVATLALQADLGLGRAGAWSARFPVQNAVLIAAVVALYGAAGVDGASPAWLSPVPRGSPSPLRRPPRSGGRLAGARGPAPDAARFGLVAAGTGALTQFVQRGGVVAAAVLSTDEETGHAAVAIGVALAATYAVAQVFVVTLPALSARQAEGAAEPALRRLAGVLLAAVLPAIALAVLAVGVAVPLVLGAAYSDAVAAFPLALATVVLAPLNALLLQAAALRLRPVARLDGRGGGSGRVRRCRRARRTGLGRRRSRRCRARRRDGRSGGRSRGHARGRGWRLVASLVGAAAVAGWDVFA